MSALPLFSSQQLAPRPAQVGLLADQRVIMADGSLKRAEELCVGDMLLGPDAKSRPVLAVTAALERTYEVTPVKGKPFVIGAFQRLPLVNTRFGHADDERSPTVMEWRRWSIHDAHLFKLQRSEAVAFATSTDALLIEPYFLGVLIGDGSIGSCVSVTTMDDEIVHMLEQQSNRWGYTIKRYCKPDNRAAAYNLTYPRGFGIKRRSLPSSQRTPYLPEALTALGVLGCKSGNKFIPDAYKTADVEVRQAVLAGLIDTDGSLSRNGYDFVSKSERLAEDVAFVARSLGMAAYVTPCTKSCQTGAVGTYYRLSLTGHVNQIPCRLPRKQADPRTQCKDVLRTGFTVEDRPGQERCIGVAVEGDRFLLDDFTVLFGTGTAVRRAA